MKPALIVFAKDPAPGRAKTRLGRAIGMETAAGLYAALATDLLEELMRGQGEWDIEIHLDRHSKFYEGFPAVKKLQEGDDLGERLYRALSCALNGGARLAAVVGSDAPVLTRERVMLLLRIEADVVLGATADGGYWGIAASRVHPGMFSGVRWSTEHALADTKAAAEAVGLRVELGPESWDLDDEDDLRRLLREGGAGPATQAFLRGWFGAAERNEAV